MDLMDLIQWQLSDGVVDQMSNQLNINDRNKTTNAANTAISILMSALSKNATSSDSALSGLMGALDRDHDGSLLDNLTGILSGNTQVSNSKMTDGAGILGHLLGGKQSNVIDLLTKMSGLNNNQSQNLLSQLAPLLLGVLGRVKKQKQMDAPSMKDYLRKSQENFVKQDNNRSLFEKLIDQDGDGSVMDEIAGMGMKVLGGLFRR